MVMLGASCSPCCIQDCNAVWPSMQAVSGSVTLLTIDSNVGAGSVVRSTEPFVVVTQPGQWRSAPSQYILDEELPGQIRVWIAGTVPAPSVGWAVPEFQQQALLWCNEQGQESAAVVRLRVAHEANELFRQDPFGGAYQGTVDQDDLYTQGLSTHAVTPYLLNSRQPPAGGFGVTKHKAIRIYIELLDGSGQVLQSRRVVTTPYPSSFVTPQNTLQLGLSIHAHVTDGMLHCWVALVDGFVFALQPVFFGNVFFNAPRVGSWHIFDPVPVTVTHSQAGVSMFGTTDPVLSDSIVTRYPLNEFIVPCIPENKELLCTADNARVRPWATEPCTRMLRTSRVRGSRCGQNHNSLLLTIPGVAIEEQLPAPFTAQVYPFAEFLNGTYELGGFSDDEEPLADGVFWFSQDNIDLTLDGVNGGRFTLTRLEISAALYAASFQLALPGSGVPGNWQTPPPQESCNEWPAYSWFTISVLIQKENPTQRRDYTRFSTNIFKILPESILSGSPVTITTGTQTVSGQLQPVHVMNWFFGLTPVNTFYGTTTFINEFPTLQLI
jgi:hypothetical protein